MSERLHRQKPIDNEVTPARRGAKLRPTHRGSVPMPLPAGQRVNVDPRPMAISHSSSRIERSTVVRDTITSPPRSSRVQRSRAAIIQRYSVVPAAQQGPGAWAGIGHDIRVADDGKMVVRDTAGAPSSGDTAFQHFYATPDIIANSRATLDANGSAVRVTQGNATISGTAPNAAPGAAPQTLHQVEMANRDLERIDDGNGGDYGAYSFNACSANMSNFIGQLRSTAHDPQELETLRVFTARFRDLDAAGADREIDVDSLSHLLETARSLISPGKGRDRAKRSYEHMVAAWKRHLAERFGINHAALPEVGEGWGLFAAGTAGVAGGGHFVPVIARSGNDRVSFENDVSNAGQTRVEFVDGANLLNPNWYVRMFGPLKRVGLLGRDDQTLYGETMRHEQDYWGSPLVTRIGSRPVL